MRLRVGLIGAGTRGTARAQTLAAMPDISFVGIMDAVPEQAIQLAMASGVPAFRSALDLFDTVDVICISVPTRDHFLLAQTAVKSGKHVFVESPATTSITECETLAQLAEEAGVEVGVSSPRRFHSVLNIRPTVAFPTLVTLQIHGAVVKQDQFHWSRRLAEAIDFCCVLVGSSGVQRVHGQAVRDTVGRLETVAFGLRFHRGAYAQVSLRRTARRSEERLTVAGTGWRIEADLNKAKAFRYQEGMRKASVETIPLVLQDPLPAELGAFLQAIQEGRPCPVSILEAQETMRLVERVLGVLR